MVKMPQQVAETPQIILSEFVKAGIAGALDGHMDNKEERQTGNTESMNTDECENDFDADGDGLNF